MTRRGETYTEIIRRQIETLGEEGGKSIIDNWIGHGEHLYLEFKEKENRTRPSVTKPDRDHLAKALSGFANSDGGLLVWGVEARRDPNDPESADVAVRVKPIFRVSGFY